MILLIAMDRLRKHKRKTNLFLKEEETSCMNIFQGSFEATKEDLTWGLVE